LNAASDLQNPGRRKASHFYEPPDELDKTLRENTLLE
jgi:hypothetical protein